MNNVRLLKAQSFLKEAMQQVLFTLDDPRLSSLSIVRVECKKSKEYAKIYFDSTGISDTEQQEILKLLKKANSVIRDHLQNVLDWYKAPNLSYEFDDEVDVLNRLDSIFKQINNKDHK